MVGVSARACAPGMMADGPAPDRHFSDPELAAIYDRTRIWGADWGFFLGLCRPGDRVLDIGCGTGRLSTAMARAGGRVTGLDPAAAMLDVARRRPGGGAVAWVRGRAQTLHLRDRFDLVVMTGHAFQTLLTDADIDTALARVSAHLSAGGRFAFDSRDPAFDWPARWSNARRTTDGIVVVSTLTAWDGARLSFNQDITVHGQVRTTCSTLRFATVAHVRAAVARAGMRVVSVNGDWDRSRRRPGATRELVVEAEKPS